MSHSPIRILIFGASGMVGQGNLRECLRDPDVVEVKTVTRSKLDHQDPKLVQLVVPDLAQLSAFSEQLTGYDACFFSIGISTAGTSETKYRQINYELPMTVARLLSELNPMMVFTYVSGAGTDSSEKGRVLWARVKGQTENEMMKLPIRGAYMFRLGGLLPKNNETSKTAWYQLIYQVTRPVHGLLLHLFPKLISTTEELGQAMLQVAKTGEGPHIIENYQIRELAKQFKS